MSVPAEKHAQLEQAPSARTHHRLEWLKRVLSSNVPHRAKVLASGLAVKWANDQTGRCNPSLTEICGFLSITEDTARRAISDLVEAGLIERLVGKGRGRKSGYLFLGPSNIVQLPTRKPESGANEAAPAQCKKRSQPCDLLPVEKGSSPAPKRSQPCNPPYKDEHTLEHTQSGCADDDQSTLDAFEEFWRAYPKPRDRDLTKRLFCEAVRDGVSPGWMIASAKREKARVGTDTHFAARSDKWIEERRWTEYPEPALANVTILDTSTDAADVATFFAEKIKAGRYVAPSAVTARLASEIVGRGLATEAQMRAAGFRV